MKSFPIQKNKNIIIIGDVMLDQFYYGNVEDTSKEDPLAKILKVKSDDYNLGGAGNVAMNIKAMDSNPYLIAVIGGDQNGEKIKSLCIKNEIAQEGILIDNQRITTAKTRLYDENQIIRFDEEECHNISREIEDKIIQHFEVLLNSAKIDGLILQDYNKGVLNKTSISRILAIAKKNNLSIFVDPKKDNFFGYKDVTIVKPNLREINWAIPDQSYQEAAKTILQKSNCEIAAITLSADGIYCLSQKKSQLYPSLANNIVDVCGAGDTVIAILSLSYLSKCNMNHMAIIANLAAADVCNSQGVIPVNYGKLSDLWLSLYKDKKKYDIA